MGTSWPCVKRLCGGTYFPEQLFVEGNATGALTFSAASSTCRSEGGVAGKRLDEEGSKLGALISRLGFRDALMSMLWFLDAATLDGSEMSTDACEEKRRGTPLLLRHVGARSAAEHVVEPDTLRMDRVHSSDSASDTSDAPEVEREPMEEEAMLLPSGSMYAATTTVAGLATLSLSPAMAAAAALAACALASCATGPTWLSPMLCGSRPALLPNTNVPGVMRVSASSSVAHDVSNSPPVAACLPWKSGNVPHAERAPTAVPVVRSSSAKANLPRSEENACVRSPSPAFHASVIAPGGGSPRRTSSTRARSLLRFGLAPCEVATRFPRRLSARLVW